MDEEPTQIIQHNMLGSDGPVGTNFLGEPVWWPPDHPANVVQSLTTEITATNMRMQDEEYRKKYFGD